MNPDFKRFQATNPPIRQMLNRTALNFFLLIAGFTFLAWFFSDIFSYIILALIVSAILRTPTNYLSQIQFFGAKIPRPLAILISFISLFSLISLFMYLFVPLIITQIRVLTGLDFNLFYQKVSGPILDLEDLLLRNRFINREKGFLLESIRNGLSDLVGWYDLSLLFNNVVSITSNFFIGLMAVLFITFFFLYEKGAIRRYFISLIPNKYFEVSIAAVSKTERLLSNYLLGLLLQMLSIFTIASFGLLIVGVEYAVTIALFAAIANLIPYVGPILGTIFGIFVGISTGALVPENQTDIGLLIIKIMMVFGVVQLTDNIFLQPVIFSKSVKAHPLVIFLAVFVGGTISGPLGMVAAIPAFTILKVSMGEFYKGYKQYQVFGH